MDKITVLLVDDEDSFRQVLAKRLDRRGFGIVEAASGPAALELMAAIPVHVVILDVKMPGMSGLEVLEKVRSRHCRTEVILLTGHASAQDGVAGMKAGAMDYLSKPVEFEHLVGKIRQAAERVARTVEAEREAEFRARMKKHMVAAERLAALGTLAAGVAHEINNPLAVINDAAGWLKLLLDKPEAKEFALADKFAKGLSTIERSVERARVITHQLLGFARRDETFITEADLFRLTEETLHLVGKEARNKHVSLALEPDKDTPLVFTDPNQIRQVLVNLLNNAIQAVDEGGSIRVRVEPDCEGAVISISDNGPGIPEDLRERIFEPFFSTKEAGVGTGLGLYMSAGIMQNLGGRLDVDSEVGRGTTFFVRLPKAHEQSAPAREAGGDWFTRVKEMVAKSEKEKGEGS